MRWIGFVVVVAALFLLAAFVDIAGAKPRSSGHHEKSHRKARAVAACPKTVVHIVRTRREVWRIQDELRTMRTIASAKRPGSVISCRYVAWIAAQWRAILKAVRRTLASISTPTGAIRYVFGGYGDQALRVAGCESNLSVWAANGQYLGLFQMGSYARSRYGHSDAALGQARSAYAYFVDSGRDWSPWSCKP